MPLPLAQPRILSDATQVLSDPGAYADNPNLIHLAQMCVMQAGGVTPTQRGCNRGPDGLTDWQRFLQAEAKKQERARLADLRRTELRQANTQAVAS